MLDWYVDGMLLLLFSFITAKLLYMLQNLIDLWVERFLFVRLKINILVTGEPIGRIFSLLRKIEKSSKYVFIHALD